MPEAARTLVKSPPELWAEVSDHAALARHLGVFGEIRITRLVPESTVAWEGERASGTVELEPAGWGTKVTVRADETPADVPTVELPAVAEAPRGGFLARLFGRRPRPAADPAPEAVVAARPPAVDSDRVLGEMLGSLGSARHRPFSRG